MLYKAFYILTALLISFLLLQPTNLFAEEQSTSTWLSDSPTLTLNKQLDPILPLVNQLELKPCMDTSFITRPKRIGQAQLNKSVCATNTMFGLYGSGYLQLEGTGVAGKLTEYYGSTKSPFIAIPKSDNMFRTYSTQGLVGLQLVKNVRQSLVPNNNVFGEVEYVVPSSATRQNIKWPGLGDLYVKYESASFSGNGKWMVVDTQFGAVRINTATGDVLPFQHAQKYGGGLNPFMKTAVSSDGRYVVASSFKNYYWRIYDLATCTGDEWTQIINSCQRNDIQNTLSSVFEGVWASEHPRFLNGTNIETYITTNNSGVVTKARYIVTAQGGTVFGTDSPAFKYLALGDSFASGEGAQKYKAHTDANGNKCHVSLVSYPYVLMDKLNYETGESVACSGAVTDDLLNLLNYIKPQASGKEDDSYDDEIFSSFLPGYRAQLHFVEQQKPEVITLSIGGNDVGFSDKIKYCIEPGTCYPTYEDRLEILHEIDNMSWKLIDAYKQIKDGAHPKSRIYVLGYPEIVKPNGNCGVNARFDAEETIFADQLVDYLNSAVERATKHAGVFYVDVQQALDGHRLCETTYSDTAVNGLTAGNDIGILGINGPIAQESFHPNEIGHRLYSSVIARNTNNFTAPMPTPDTSELPPNKEGLGILDQPKSNRSLNVVNYDHDTENNIIYKDNGITEEFIKAVFFVFAPGTSIQLQLQSDPADLGTYQLNDARQVTFNAKIPKHVTAGYHMLHIYGTNMAGETVDIQRLVYVAETKNDIDGDGILNVNELCAYGEPINQDTDQDGIDDACDGYIGQPPAVNLAHTSSAQIKSTEVAFSKSFASDQTQTRQQSNITQEATTDAGTQTTQPATAYVATASDKQDVNNNQTKSEQKVLSSILGSTNQAKEVAISKKLANPWVWTLAIFSALGAVTYTAILAWRNKQSY